MSYGMSSPTGKTNSVTGSFSRDIIPKGFKKGQLSQFTPEQMQLFQQLFQHVGPESYLSQLAGGDEETFRQIEAPALRQFSELQGGLASRFSGMGGQGSLGSRRSSGFQNEQTAAASNFAQQLQSQRQSLQQQAIKDLMGMSGDLLGQRPQEKFLVQKPQKPNPWASFGQGLGGAIPGAISGFLTGGPAGAALGGIGGAASALK
jgi:hypothetical protein